MNFTCPKCLSKYSIDISILSVDAIEYAKCEKCSSLLGITRKSRDSNDNVENLFNLETEKLQIKTEDFIGNFKKHKRSLWIRMFKFCSKIIMFFLLLSIVMGVLAYQNNDLNQWISKQLSIKDIRLIPSFLIEKGQEIIQTGKQIFDEGFEKLNIKENTQKESLKTDKLIKNQDNKRNKNKKESFSIDKPTKNIEKDIVKNNKNTKIKNKRLTLLKRIKVSHYPKEINKEKLFKILKKKKRSIQKCIYQSMSKKEFISEKINIGLTINSKGHVVNTEVRPIKLKNTYLGKCSSKKIKRWKFPEFTGKSVQIMFSLLLQ